MTSTNVLDFGLTLYLRGLKIENVLSKKGTWECIFACSTDIQIGRSETVKKDDIEVTGRGGGFLARFDTMLYYWPCSGLTPLLISSLTELLPFCFVGVSLTRTKTTRIEYFAIKII